MSRAFTNTRLDRTSPIRSDIRLIDAAFSGLTYRSRAVSKSSSLGFGHSTRNSMSFSRDASTISRGRPPPKKCETVAGSATVAERPMRWNGTVVASWSRSRAIASCVPRRSWTS